MKKQLITTLTLGALFFTGCGKTETTPALPPWINQVTVSTAFATATATGLRFGIEESAKRQAMAKLLQYIANQCNAFSTAAGDNSPDALAAFINSNVPADIKNSYPELVSFSVPLIVSGYGLIYKEHSTDAKTLSTWLGWAATGVSMGAANFAGN